MKRKERLTYLTSFGLLAIDFFLIIIISIIQFGFDLSNLVSVDFWTSVLINLIASFIAYFAMIGIGKNETEKRDDIIALVDDVNGKFRDIDKLYLSADLTEFIGIENAKNRCEAYIEKLNKALRDSKTPEPDRIIFSDDKKKAIEWLNYYVNLNKGEKSEPPTCAFDIYEKDIFKVLVISERSFTAEEVYTESRKIGAYDEKKIIAKDSKNKLLLTIAIAIFLSGIQISDVKYGWEILFDFIYKMFLLAFNCFMGFQEGKKLIAVYKFGAFKERQQIITRFFNKMFILGKIKNNA